ncbi:TetR/AcrR family transcriptional regulator [Streptomyces sp. 891-h]|uniref:TetR/AcrR family transcriptional regulator n=1 Tax=Streptomyces sp. 891-h TaxID=2720714 RepID=UPI001FA95294|nr:TetR/AcrR family transcriptional regulator [Streptomyces sp. 891-h]UNZ15959.1 TetR/AcrR family transcriptional regulator [Streptomyces sp. 891-h]
MASRAHRPERRQEPLSRERIVSAAVELLDTVGEGGLTFRALAERLATGPGAIYWHLSGKAELLGAATDAVVTTTLTDDDTDATPQEAIRALALGVFDALDAHPWIGAYLARSPGRSTMLRVFERIGRQVQALDVPAAAQFTAASALLNYILGVAGQNAANAVNARTVQPNTDRTEFLDAVATAWAELDPDEYAFTRSVTDQLREHDDRAEFLAGIDLILAGLTARR